MDDDLFWPHLIPSYYNGLEAEVVVALAGIGVDSNKYLMYFIQEMLKL